MRVRLFAAIEPDAATLRFLMRAHDALAASGVHGKFEAQTKLHLTLAFLGATPDASISVVIAALREATALCEPFQLVLDTFGVFPNERHPRIVWVGPSEPNPGFERCARAVYDGLAQAGFPPERKPHPHVTLCRLTADPGGLLPRLGESWEMGVRELALFQSVPAGPSTRYVALERFRLRDE
ncbi:MAG: RNA 2',3'-cyclic phosphodiesterase [Candidatus Eremiobacteraeota bacterium]|nr:RNA 2',3'-cyclic phosphodiesterase [Candidatus Eremiobacteraeota bacterium]